MKSFIYYDGDDLGIDLYIQYDSGVHLAGGSVNTGDGFGSLADALTIGETNGSVTRNAQVIGSFAPVALAVCGFFLCSLEALTATSQVVGVQHRLQPSPYLTLRSGPLRCETGASDLD